MTSSEKSQLFFRLSRLKTRCLTYMPRKQIPIKSITNPGGKHD